MHSQLNPILENLQDQVIQERVIKLIHAHNPFQVFEKKNIEYNGAFGEYIGTQPLEGVEWNKNLTGAEAKFNKLPEVFSCRLPIIVDNVYPSIQNKQVMKRALQNSDILAELSERLIDDMKVQATRDIRKEIIELMCQKDLYNTKAWQEWEKVDCDISTLDKAVAVISWIKRTSSAMLEDSADYNKGYQKPNSATWHKVIANSQSKRDQVLVIEPDFLQELETRFLSDLANLELVSLKSMFLEVIERKMINKVKVMIRDINSFAYTIIAEDGIRSELIAASGSSKFYFQPTVIGGVIPFANACALVSK